mgnify:CR=1 FL=1|tara:strand:+ start:2810 stop:4090 length:1281 start_codon:yes stop_codon:yes gene_type:complete
MRKLSDIIDNEALDYAMYTVENRAIPSVIDGFKPVHRFILTMALQVAKNDFAKVAAIAGSVSSLGYNHGEVSAQDACKLLASDWSNNVPFLHGRGNFGSRLVNDSAAARYIYAKVHQNFFDIYKDMDILEAHSDLEIKTPKYYIPIIPTVLLNSIEGVATGFATKILPYSLRDIKKAVAQCLAKKPLDTLVPTFPQFKGSVSRDGNRVTMSGIYNLTGYKLTITEIPIGFDREKYVILLDKLEELDKIIAYEDRCDKNGVHFVIKLRRTLKWDDKKVIALFKMEKTITENITTLDESGKLKIFNSPEDLVIYFVEYKMGVLKKRIDFMKSKVSSEIELNLVRVKWIKANLNGEVDYKNLSKKSLEKLIGDKYGNKFIEKLIPMNLYQLTTDEIEKLEGKLQDSELRLEYWKGQNQLSQYIADIKSI